jgi:hypothetical protein
MVRIQLQHLIEPGARSQSIRPTLHIAPQSFPFLHPVPGPNLLVLGKSPFWSPLPTCFLANPHVLEFPHQSRHAVPAMARELEDEVGGVLAW